MKLVLHFLALSLSVAAIFAAPIDDTIPLVATSADILKLQPGSHVVHDNKELIDNRPVRQSHQLTRPSPINPDVIVEPPPPTSETTILVTPVPDVKSADWHRESGTPLSVAVPTTEVEQLPKEAKAADAVKPAETKTVAEDKPRSTRDAESVKEEKKINEEAKPIAPEEVKEDKLKLLLSRGSTKFGTHKDETEDKKSTVDQKDAPEKVEQARPSRSTPPKVENSPKPEQDKPVADAPLLVKKCEKPKPTKNEEEKSNVEKPKAALAEPQHASGHQAIKEEVEEKKPEIEEPKVTVDEIKRAVRNTPPKVEAAETKKEDIKVTVEEAKSPSSRPVIKEDATVKKAEDKAVAELPTESKTLKHKRMVRATDRLSSNDDKKKNNDREQITNYPDEKYDNEGPHFSFPVPVSKILGAKTIKYPQQKTDEEGTEESTAEESSK